MAGDVNEIFSQSLLAKHTVLIYSYSTFEPRRRKRGPTLSEGTVVNTVIFKITTIPKLSVRRR